MGATDPDARRSSGIPGAAPDRRGEAAPVSDRGAGALEFDGRSRRVLHFTQVQRIDYFYLHLRFPLRGKNPQLKSNFISSLDIFSDSKTTHLFASSGFLHLVAVSKGTNVPALSLKTCVVFLPGRSTEIFSSAGPPRRLELELELELELDRGVFGYR